MCMLLGQCLSGESVTRYKRGVHASWAHIDGGVQAAINERVRPEFVRDAPTSSTSVPHLPHQFHIAKQGHTPRTDEPTDMQASLPEGYP